MLFYEDGKIIPCMVLLSCQKRVERQQVHSALEILIDHHPNLRMNISKSKNSLDFIEMKNFPISVNEIETFDWVQATTHLFNRNIDEYDNTPLWKFIWIQNSYNYKNNLFQFIFSIHHSIADFPYTHLLVFDFLNILKDIQNGRFHQTYTKFPFSPSIEQIEGIRNNNVRITENTLSESSSPENTPSESSSSEGNNTITALLAYEYCYKDEIKSLRDTTRIISASAWKTIEGHTVERFSDKCKKEMVSKNSALLAAMLMSFGKLLEKKGCNFSVKFEFAFMTNLRRYIKENSPFYPGMAVVTCPVSINLDLTEASLSPDAFWDLARIIKSKTSIALNNNKPLTVLHEDVPRWATGERNKGKSQTVFLLSNVDQVATLEPQTAKNFQIENFQVISDIKPDYSPIFVGLSHIRNGSLYCCIGYSSNYTSLETAETFSNNITNIIQDSSVITF